ncbi:hypothetical protein [Clostridium butyricum]|uniref:hypothetical protein n=1 Tax=Clostridium butyricum TaxID=1492 RepID=UPI002105607C|nr:hypothetical protein [Clostridium butyricum]MCQ2015596.1 hypothetical protein [Clostridium butyricum]MCQ2024406.1 hypothetical protein [Clostridium butyricum]
MNNSKKFANIILSIILVVTIILTVLSSIIRFSATNKGIYLRLLEDSNTYSNVEQALSNKMVAILGNDISENLKESIITEEDIRKEADTVLDCIISDLIKGEANIPEIDTTIYKERVAKALNTLTGFEATIKNDKNLTSSIQSNDMCLTPINTVNSNEKLIGENMFNINNLNENRSNDLTLVNMASRAELEAQGRSMLKEKGLTEEEARRKAAERGISEQDVWNYLEENGYLDEESQSEESSDSGVQKDEVSDKSTDSSNSSNSTDSNETINNNVQADKSNANNDNKNNETKVSKKRIQEIVTSVLMDGNKNFDEKVNEISSKLMEEAEKIINAEMEKLNFSKVINSNEFNAAIKITSALYNNFYVLLLLIVIMCVLIFFVNKESVVNGLVIIGNSILAAGVIMSLIFGYVYMSKVYTHIDINLNKAYFEPMFLQCAEYFSKLLCAISIIILFLGLIINIFMMKIKLTRR